MILRPEVCMLSIEAARNLACSGAKPLAVTNNLNFGNPEKLEIMGQIVGTIEGIKKSL